MPNDRAIAYFTMEIAVNSDMPTYSGGLGPWPGTPSGRPPISRSP
jgi:glucan phosphorylase